MWAPFIERKTQLMMDEGLTPGDAATQARDEICPANGQSAPVSLVDSSREPFHRVPPDVRKRYAKQVKQAREQDELDQLRALSARTAVPEADDLEELNWVASYWLEDLELLEPPSKRAVGLLKWVRESPGEFYRTLYTVRIKDAIIAKGRFVDDGGVTLSVIDQISAEAAESSSVAAASQVFVEDNPLGSASGM